MNNSWCQKYNLLIFDEIDSTNSEAIRLAKTSPSSNYVIVAKSQTKGHGKNNKFWHSDFGNFYASILLEHNIAISLLPQLSFVTSITVYDTIVSLAKQSQKLLNVKLKWPNDVFIEDKKVAGILLESISLSTNYCDNHPRVISGSQKVLKQMQNNILQKNDIQHYLIIGVGINIKRSPSNIDQLATNLLEQGIEVKELEQLLDIFMINFEKYFSQWQQEGFSQIRQYWLKKADKLNELITINDGNITISGIFKDISEIGAIRVQAHSGEIYTLLAGDVFFL